MQHHRLADLKIVSCFESVSEQIGVSKKSVIEKGYLCVWTLSGVLPMQNPRRRSFLKFQLFVLFACVFSFLMHLIAMLVQTMDVVTVL
jgi:hypothetical protein